MARALAILAFVALAAENYADMPFERRWETIFRPLGELLYRASPVKAPTLGVLVLVMLAIARRKPGARVARVAAFDRVLWLNLAAVGALFVWGMLRGGSLLPAMLQFQVMMFLPLCAFLFIAGLRSEADFLLVGKAIVYAAFYRGFLVLYFGLHVAPKLGATPATMTTHADTILFATAMVILLSWAIESPSRRTWFRTLLGATYLLVVVHFNNRRLAYVCIGGSVIVLYLLLDSPEFKRRIKRSLIWLAPVAAVYVAVGWGSAHPLFKPVKAISSMAGENQDSSSQTRDIENYNLIVTLKPNLVAGRGFGHEYDEVSVAYSIADAFPMYRYIPHNSVLGLWAFGGYLGSTAWWLCMVVATYLGARAYTFASTPLGRTICAVSTCQVVIYALQGYGDMGLSAWVGNITLGVAFAGASRMAAWTGAHPARGVEPSTEESEGPLALEEADGAALPEVS